MSIRKVHRFKGFNMNSLEIEDNSNGKNFNIKFEGERYPYIQLGEMYVPFGTKVYSEPFEKHELTLSPPNRIDDSVKAQVLEKFQQFDNQIKKLLSENAKKYFGKKMTKSDIEDNYYPFLRVSEKNERTFTNLTFRLPNKDGRYMIKVFDENRKPVVFDEDNTFESVIHAGRIIKPIVRIIRMWVTQKGKVGTQWEISQIMLVKNTGVGCLFSESDDDGEEDNTESNTNGTVTTNGNAVSDSDSESDDNEEEEDSDEEEEEPEPVPVKPKKEVKPKIVIKKKK